MKQKGKVMGKKAETTYDIYDMKGSEVKIADIELSVEGSLCYKEIKLGLELLHKVEDLISEYGDVTSSHMIIKVATKKR